MANKRIHWPDVRLCERFQIPHSMHPASDCGATDSLTFGAAGHTGGATKKFLFLLDFSHNFSIHILGFILVLQLFDCL